MASRWSSIALLSTLLMITAESRAGSHLWRIHELFSTADGSVQFIELHECCGSHAETFIGGLEFTSDATGAVYEFPAHLDGSTDKKYLLLATASFAAMPGAPEPDFIIAPHFLEMSGDLLRYSPVRGYDQFSFEPGDMPLDGLLSLQVTDHVEKTFKWAVNSPTNFLGETGTVSADGAMSSRFRRGDCDDDGERSLTDAVYLLEALFVSRQLLECLDACDANDDDGLDVSDALRILAFLFLDGIALPGPLECGEDRSSETLGCSSFAGCT